MLQYKFGFLKNPVYSPTDFNPAFELLQASQFKAGDRSCVGSSDSPKSRFIETLVVSVATHILQSFTAKHATDGSSTSGSNNAEN